MTMKKVIKILVDKYPDYACYLKKCKDLIKEDKLICSLKEAREYIKYICSALNIGIVKTAFVESAVTKTLQINGLN